MAESMKGYCKKCRIKRVVYMDEVTEIAPGEWDVTFACVVCDNPVLPDVAGCDKNDDDEE